MPFYHFMARGAFMEDVYVEAVDHHVANDRAEASGLIHFDGVARGLDCPCCGDNFVRAFESDAEYDVMGISVADLLSVKSGGDEILIGDDGWVEIVRHKAEVECSTPPDAWIVYADGNPGRLRRLRT